MPLAFVESFRHNGSYDGVAGMVVRSEEGMEGGMEEDEKENIPLVCSQHTENNNLRSLQLSVLVAGLLSAKHLYALSQFSTISKF
jgi:hypothetical protein